MTDYQYYDILVHCFVRAFGRQGSANLRGRSLPMHSAIINILVGSTTLLHVRSVLQRALTQVKHQHHTYSKTMVVYLSVPSHKMLGAQYDRMHSPWSRSEK